MNCLSEYAYGLSFALWWFFAETAANSSSVAPNSLLYDLVNIQFGLQVLDKKLHLRVLQKIQILQKWIQLLNLEEMLWQCQIKK